MSRCAMPSLRRARRFQRGLARRRRRARICYTISVVSCCCEKRLGELLAREEGKTRAEAIGEVTRAAQVFRFFAGETVRYGARLGL